MRRTDGSGVVTGEQEKAILALIEQPTVPKAAEVAGVAISTIYRWLKEPIFAEAYREARRESFRHAISLTQRYAPAAIQTLMKVMQDPAAAHTAYPCLPLPLRADPTARLHGWSRGPEPLEAPGIGPYGPAAERCVYRSKCEEIIKYINEIDRYSKGSTSALLEGPGGLFRP